MMTTEEACMEALAIIEQEMAVLKAKYTHEMNALRDKREAFAGKLRELTLARATGNKPVTVSVPRR